MALIDYARLAVAVNGNVLSQITSIDVEWNSGQNRVDLLNEGLSGFTPGSGDVTVSLGFVVPLGGLEQDFIADLVPGAVVTLQIFLAGKDYVGKGKHMNCKMSQSVNASVEGSLQWTGQIAKLQ